MSFDPKDLICGDRYVWNGRIFALINFSALTNRAVLQSFDRLTGEFKSFGVPLDEFLEQNQPKLKT